MRGKKSLFLIKKCKYKCIAKDSKGFTLAELLVVVAILAIIIAVAIPLFSGFSKKAKWSVDLANERSAMTAAAAKYMLDGSVGEAKYFYSSSGKVSMTEIPEDYGMSDELPPQTNAEAGSPAPKGNYVTVTLKPDGHMIVRWEGSGSSAPSGTGTDSTASSTVDTSKGGLDDGKGNITGWETLIKDGGMIKLDTLNNGKHAVIGAKNEISGALYIKEGLTDIGASVFKDATGLTEVTIPKTVDDIGQNTFGNLKNLSKINWEYNDNSGAYRSAKYIFSGSASASKPISIDFYGTEAQWNSIKGKTGLASGTYTIQFKEADGH